MSRSGTKEHGMPFMDRLVRAVAMGEKTETRRLIGWHNGSCESAPIRSLHWSSGEGWPDPSYAPLGMVKIPGPHETVHRVWCRYEPGDTLWIREAWAVIEKRHEALGTYEEIRGTIRDIGAADAADRLTLYRADGPPLYNGEGDVQHGIERWRPSIHMPRARARYLLRVEEVRGERLHEITEAGARAEGIRDQDLGEARARFQDLWDQTNGHRAGARWADNPLVWAIRFSLITGKLPDA